MQHQRDCSLKGLGCTNFLTVSLCQALHLLEVEENCQAPERNYESKPSLQTRYDIKLITNQNTLEKESL